MRRILTTLARHRIVYAGGYLALRYRAHDGQWLYLKSTPARRPVHFAARVAKYAYWTLRGLI